MYWNSFRISTHKKIDVRIKARMLRSYRAICGERSAQLLLARSVFNIQFQAR